MQTTIFSSILLCLHLFLSLKNLYLSIKVFYAFILRYNGDALTGVVTHTDSLSITEIDPPSPQTCCYDAARVGHGSFLKQATHLLLYQQLNDDICATGTIQSNKLCMYLCFIKSIESVLCGIFESSTNYITSIGFVGFFFL